MRAARRIWLVGWNELNHALRWIIAKPAAIMNQVSLLISFICKRRYAACILVFAVLAAECVSSCSLFYRRHGFPLESKARERERSLQACNDQ